MALDLSSFYFVATRNGCTSDHLSIKLEISHADLHFHLKVDKRIREVVAVQVRCQMDYNRNPKEKLVKKLKTRKLPSRFVAIVLAKSK